MALTLAQIAELSNKIKKIIIYAANDGGDGYPEKHEFTKEEYFNNIGVTFGTGETLFTQFPIPNNKLRLKIVNGFVFSSGKYGRLLAMKLIYNDDKVSWIKTISMKTARSEHTDTMIGGWTAGLTMQQIVLNPNYKGMPLIGEINDYIVVEFGEPVEDTAPDPIDPIPPDPTDPEPDPDPDPDPNPDPPDPDNPNPPLPTDPDNPGGGGSGTDLADLQIYLSPANSTIAIGDTLEIGVVIVKNDGGSITSFGWDKDGSFAMSQENSSKIVFTSTAAGSYVVKFTMENEKGQKATATALVNVVEDSAKACSVLLRSSSLTYEAGKEFTVETENPYITTGVWQIPNEFYILDMQLKKATMRTYTPGIYKIAYAISNGYTLCTAELIITIVPSDATDPDHVEQKPDPEKDFEFINEPGIAGSYKYPQKILRNARYRGPRESEKYQDDDYEMNFDIRNLAKDHNMNHEYIEYMLERWFNPQQNTNNFKYVFEHDTDNEYEELMYKVLENYINTNNLDGSMIKLMEDSTVIVNLVTTGKVLTHLGLDFKKIEGRVKAVERAYK